MYKYHITLEIPRRISPSTLYNEVRDASVDAGSPLPHWTQAPKEVEAHFEHLAAQIDDITKLSERLKSLLWDVYRLYPIATPDTTTVEALGSGKASMTFKTHANIDDCQLDRAFELANLVFCELPAALKTLGVRYEHVSQDNKEQF